MAKTVKIDDNLHKKLKQLSDNSGVPMNEVIDTLLTGNDRGSAPAKNNGGDMTTKDMKDFQQFTGFASQFAQLMMAMKEIFNPASQARDLFQSAAAISQVQQAFGGSNKSQYIDKMLDMLLSNPGLQAVLTQLIMRMVGVNGSGAPLPMPMPQQYTSPPAPAQQNNEEELDVPTVDELMEAAEGEQDSYEEKKLAPETDQNAASISPKQLGALVRRAVEGGNDQVIEEVIKGAVGNNPQVVGMLMNVFRQARAQQDKQEGFPRR